MKKPNKVEQEMYEALWLMGQMFLNRTKQREASAAMRLEHLDRAIARFESKYPSKYHYPKQVTNYSDS